MAKGVKGSSPQIAPKRTSIIIDPSLSDKLRIIAAIQGTTQKDLIEAAIKKVIDTYEKKNGPIK